VRLVETWGSDERIVEAARMSTQKGFKGWGSAELCQGISSMNPGITCKRGIQGCVVEHTVGDEKLLRYLWEHKHGTPFEMAGAIFEVQAPIFVFREWHRHRTQSFNEMSARYEPLPDVNYIPTVERLMINAGGTNKQAGTVKGADDLTLERAQAARSLMEIAYESAQEDYQRMLQAGVPKELARAVLPVGRYSKMRASANLRNWLGFLSLRMDLAAQYEIRVYANAVHDMLVEHFPRTLALFDEGPGEE
jgi:thymidylate synthase (FAD)